MIRKSLDTVFWRQYADEIRLHPEAPAMCCFLGMSQVSIVIFLFTMGLLAPVVHMLRYILRLTGFEDSRVSGFNLYWFIGMFCASVFASLFVSFRLYWRYRLTPDRAAALNVDASYDRDIATITAVKATGSALIFMAVMLVLFR